MPIYEYQCQSCGEVEEKFVKISDPAPESCKSCEKGPMTKVISRTGFILKGQGWYETDFKSKPKADKTTTESKPAADCGTGGCGSTACAAPAKD